VILMPHTFDPIDHPAQIVGQPILAAAGFQPAFAPRRLAHVPKEPPERRLRARLPAPTISFQAQRKGGGWAAPSLLKLQDSRTKLRRCTSVRTRSRAARCSCTTGNRL